MPGTYVSPDWYETGRTIITDENYQEYATGSATPDGMSRGYEQRDWTKHPLGDFCAPFPLPEIPQSEWRDRIKDLEGAKATAKDHKILSGFQSLDQDGTNYCWINAIIAAMHYAYAMAGQPHVPLSPASVGAPLKGYKNVGGWGSQGAKYIMENGVCPQSLWPANAINRKYDTEESRAERKNWMIVEMYELKPNSFSQLASALLYGFTVAIGLAWWSHEVLADRLIATPDDFGTEIDNSWKYTWGDNGHGILTRQKSVADDMVAVRLITPH
jgi:hypothetical protein